MARQPSSIKQRLPKEIFGELQALLREGRVTQKEILERINGMLEEEGHAERITKSSLNRYSLRMEKKIARMREAREVAEGWAGRLGGAPEGELGRLIVESIRSMVFDVQLKLDELFEEGGLKAEMLPETVNVLKNLALTAQRLEVSSSLNAKREGEIRRQAKEEAAEAATQVAKRGGLSADTVQALRREILGIAA